MLKFNFQMMKMFMERQAAMMQMMTNQIPGPSSDGSEPTSYVHVIGSQLVPFAPVQSLVV